MRYHCWVGGNLFPPLPYASPYGADYRLEVCYLEQIQLPSDRCFLDVAPHMFLFRPGWGGGVLETREPAVTLGGNGGEDPQALFMGSVTAESRPTLLLTARSCGAPQGFHSDKASGGKTSERLEASL